MRKSLIGAVSLVASLALASSVLATNGFTNGSFEDGSFSGTGFETLSPLSNADAIAGWRVTDGTVDWVSNSYSNGAGTWYSQEGTYSVDMNGSSPGTISQTFDTTVNNIYTVDFYVSNNTSCSDGPSTKSMTVSADGSSETVNVDSSHSVYSDGWVPATSFMFPATSDTATLEFAADSSNTSNCGVVVDNVTVSETPATGAWCKNHGWSSMFDASGTAFKNQGGCVSFYATSGQVPIGNETAPQKANFALCKSDGWQGMTDASGTSFKNQGACVSYYARGGTAPTDTATSTDVTVGPTDVTASQCKAGGWQSLTGPSFKNQGACIHYYGKAGAAPNGK